MSPLFGRKRHAHDDPPQAPAAGASRSTPAVEIPPAEITPQNPSAEPPPPAVPLDNAAVLAAEIEQLDALPLAQLAVEIMVKGFGPDGPGGPGRRGTIEAPSVDAARIGLADIARAVSPAYAGRDVGPELQLRFSTLVAEGLQILENASLVRISWRGGLENYLATRLGRAAVERGAVERVLAGGDL
jgi:hypothetical protein